MPAGLTTPVTIKDVAAQSRKKKKKRNPEKLVSPLSNIVQAQKDRDGPTGPIRQRENIRHGVRAQHGQMLFRRTHEAILLAIIDSRGASQRSITWKAVQAAAASNQKIAMFHFQVLKNAILTVSMLKESEKEALAKRVELSTPYQEVLNHRRSCLNWGNGARCIRISSRSCGGVMPSGWAQDLPDELEETHDRAVH